jgi:hypothetical protein
MTRLNCTMRLESPHETDQAAPLFAVTTISRRAVGIPASLVNGDFATVIGLPDVVNSSGILSGWE